MFPTSRWRSCQRERNQNVILTESPGLDTQVEAVDHCVRQDNGVIEAAEAQFERNQCLEDADD